MAEFFGWQLTLAPNFRSLSPHRNTRLCHPSSPSTFGSDIFSLDTILELLQVKNSSFLKAQDKVSDVSDQVISSSPSSSPELVTTPSSFYAETVAWVLQTSSSPRSATSEGTDKAYRTNLKDNIQRVKDIRAFQKKRGNCFRCGEHGHKVEICRTVRVYFHCKAIGHLVSSCLQLFLKPSPSSKKSKSHLYSHTKSQIYHSKKYKISRSKKPKISLKSDSMAQPVL